MSHGPQVVLVVFPGAQSLDITGPLEVFAHAARDRRGLRYRTILASAEGGVVTTSSGLQIVTSRLDRLRSERGTTVLVVGGNAAGVAQASRSDVFVRELRRLSANAQRFGSVCTGAFLLAKAGLADGHRITTHWRAATQLREQAPSSEVDAGALYIHEGRLWTSAGVTAGIDMALAMVEEDSGRSLADAIAAELVVFARRPGFQTQYSDLLQAQTKAGDPLASAQKWAQENLQQLTVPALARRAGVSERTLHRRVVEHTGHTPAKWIERMRLDEARLLLATTDLSLKDLAFRVGLRDAPQLSRSFVRAFGISPGSYRRTHGSPARASSSGDSAQRTKRWGA